MPGIFISYRNIKRSYAPMLIDQELDRRFGSGNVFQAGRSNLPGTAFPREIMRWLQECSLLIVLIDPPWVNADLGLLRDPKDWVRREISYALRHGKEVLPVLLDGASMPKARALPRNVAPLTQRIALRMETRTADADVLRLIGEVERLAPDLVLATLSDQPLPAPPLDHPGALLRAEHEAIPFRPRRELDQLAGWCADRAGPRVRLVTGPAAAGKTRLALRLTAQLRAMGWQAGLLSTSAPARALERLGEIATPCLVVIDDAETRPEQVQTALRSLAVAPDAPARLLLLARSGGDWLDRLQDDRDDWVAALADGIVPLQLSPLVPAEGDFAAVCAAFAGRLELPVPPPAEQPAPGTMLELQAAALAHLVPSRGTARPPLHRMLELERDYWRRTAPTFGLAEPGHRNLTEIMTAVTLFGASTEPEADTLIASLRTFRGRPADTVDSWRDLLRTVLPGPAPLNPLQPEQVGEDVVAEFLRSGRSLSGTVPEVTDEQAGRALVMLGRCLDRHPDVGGHVAAFLADAPGRLLPLAMTALAAVPRPELLAERMHETLGRVPAADLGHLVTALPQRSEALAGFAVAVTERALAAARQADADDVAATRLARLLATRLAYLRERPADAAEVARAAVSQLVALADIDGQWRAELAEAHAALAMALDLDPKAQADALDAGETAVATYRTLLREDRRDAALATALNNQAIRLKRADRTEPALDLAAQAHELTRPLHETRPTRFRSLHADVEDTLSMLMELNGQPAQAERVGRHALRLRRTLAAARPDAYRPQLAATLYNLGLLLSTHGGDRTEVRALWAESVAIFDPLAARQPGRFGEQRDRALRHLGSLGATADD